MSDRPSDSSRDRPFVYIASLRRTGSTVLGEALTELPYSFIFREPRLDMNWFAVKPRDAARLMEVGVDLTAFARRHRVAASISRRLGIREAYMVGAFKKDLLPQLRRHVQQVGVKEIRLGNWRQYHVHFPDMRILLTGRDPRDIYISLYFRVASGQGRWTGSYTPQRVAEHLNEEFAKQLEMFDTGNCMKVRYEELATNPDAILREVKRFADNPVPEVGPIGGFIGMSESRSSEFELHGKHITTQRVSRWRTEQNRGLVTEAQRVYDSMPEYCDFWGYAR
jgi:hypothetical protein